MSSTLQKKNTSTPEDWCGDFDVETYQVGDNDPVRTFKRALSQWQQQGGEFLVHVIEHTGEVEGGGRDWETGLWEGGQEEIKIHTFRWENWSDEDEEAFWDWSDEPINTETETCDWEG